MAEPKFLAIKDFERFQHYKDRAPLWIKLHTSVLSDFGFLSLPEPAQAQLLKLWLIASKMDNRIPNDRKFICAQIFTKKPYIAELVAAGFLVETDEPATPVRADWSTRYIPEVLRRQVLAASCGLCAACGSSDNVEIDHVVPISRGGTSDASNLQALCRSCNRRKRVRSATAEQLATQMAGQEHESAEPREEIEEEKSREDLQQQQRAAERHAEIEQVRSRLASDTDRDAFDTLLSRANDRYALAVAIRSALDGQDTATPTPSLEQMGHAIRDMAANGERPTMRLMRGYLRDANAEKDRAADASHPRAAKPAGAIGQRAFDTTMDALRDIA